MSLLHLLERATPSSEPVFTGEWATLTFRPDLGSRQEFIVGVAAAVAGDTRPHIKWLPSLAKLSHLYGETISSTDAQELWFGAERAILDSFQDSLSKVDGGSPHLRVVTCGYIATDDIDLELTNLLKRHAGGLWSEPRLREPAADNEWAYALMRNTLDHAKARIFVPHRTITIGNRIIRICLDNGSSYGNIVSARYANYQTIEKHISASMRQVVIAHKLIKRNMPPALFVVLPETETSVENILSRKTKELLEEIEDMGIVQYCDQDPAALARSLEHWASI